MNNITLSTPSAYKLSTFALIIGLAISASGCVIEVDGNGGMSGGMCLDQSCTTTCQGGHCETVCSTDSCLPSDTAVSGSCLGMCGMKFNDASCQCDAACAENGDCCVDFEPVCIAETVHETSGVVITRAAAGSSTDTESGALSCDERCGVYDSAAVCQCDAECDAQGDCCADLETMCAVATSAGQGRTSGGASAGAAASCEARCGEYSDAATCQCDDKCAENNDCCTDLVNVCAAP